MEASTSVAVQRLHLRDDEIPLLEESADVQLVDGGPPAQRAAGQVNRGEGQGGQQRGGDVYEPAAGLDGDDAANEEVADLRGVARGERGDGEELVGAGEGAGDGGGDGAGVLCAGCAVAAGWVELVGVSL